jgi:hypothetical protein
MTASRSCLWTVWFADPGPQELPDSLGGPGCLRGPGMSWQTCGRPSPISSMTSTPASAAAEACIAWLGMPASPVLPGHGFGRRVLACEPPSQVCGA